MKATACLFLSMLTLACGGGGGGGTAGPASPPPNPPTLAYTDPGGSGWRLERDPSSTNIHLILTLRAPVQGSGRGVWTTFQISGPITFSKPRASDSGFISFGGALGTDPATAVKTSADKLVVGIFVKGGTPPAATYTGQAVLQMALDLPAGTAAGTPITLTASKIRHLNAGGMIEDQAIAIGAIAIQ